MLNIFIICIYRSLTTFAFFYHFNGDDNSSDNDDTSDSNDNNGEKRNIKHRSETF